MSCKEVYVGIKYWNNNKNFEVFLYIFLSISIKIVETMVTEKINPLWINKQILKRFRWFADVRLNKMGRAKRIWYLLPMRAAKVQASLRIRAVSPEPLLLAHTSSESRGTFRQKARSLAPLNGWACAVKICHDGMLEDTNSLDGAQIIRLVQITAWKTSL